METKPISANNLVLHYIHFSLGGKGRERKRADGKGREHRGFHMFGWVKREGSEGRSRYSLSLLDHHFASSQTQGRGEKYYVAMFNCCSPH